MQAKQKPQKQKQQQQQQQGMTGTAGAAAVNGPAGAGGVQATTVSPAHGAPNAAAAASCPNMQAALLKMVTMTPKARTPRYWECLAEMEQRYALQLEVVQQGLQKYDDLGSLKIVTELLSMLRASRPANIEAPPYISDEQAKQLYLNATKLERMAMQMQAIDEKKRRQQQQELEQETGSANSSACSSCGSSRSSSDGGTTAGAGSTPPQSQVLDMQLLLDDCALLLQYSSNLAPVLRGVAEWVATGLKDTTYTGLADSVNQYLTAQVYAASSACSSRVVSDGPRRRTLLPRLSAPNYTLSPAKLGHYLDVQLMLMYHKQGKLPKEARIMMANLVAHAARDVAKELGLDEGSAAATALTHATVYAGRVAVGCASLNVHLGIELLTVQQLVQALRLGHEEFQMLCLQAAEHGGELGDDATHTAAYTIHKALTLATTGSSSSSSTSSSSSSTAGTGNVALKRDDDADGVCAVLYSFCMWLATMTEWDGPLSQAAALAAAVHPTGALDGVRCAPQSAAQGSAASEAAAARAVAAAAAATAAAAAASGAAAQPQQAADSGGDRGAYSSHHMVLAEVLAISEPPAPLTPVELVMEVNLRARFWGMRAFESTLDVPLPQEALQLLVKLKLHTTCSEHGWNALHFACATHRIELARQLLEAGASASAPEEGGKFLQPLHLACMGQVCSTEQWLELIKFSDRLEWIATYTKDYGPGCPELVQLLLEKGADPNAWAGLGPQKFTPLHIVGCWTGGDGEVHDRIYSNPFMGEVLCNPTSISSSGCINSFHLMETQADLLLKMAADGESNPMSGLLKTKIEGQPFPKGRWDESLGKSARHLLIVGLLYKHGADLNAQALPQRTTPLMMAAYSGNAAVVDLLCRMGADTELARTDGARALEFAAAQGYPRVGWTLLCHRANAVPQWVRRDEPAPYQAVSDHLWKTPELEASKGWQMLVLNAVRSKDKPWNIRFLERLLADWAPVEHVWTETGETPLLKAISRRDLDMVRLLVRAGADVNASLTTGISFPAVACAMYDSQQKEADAELLQILIDAGADLKNWVTGISDYGFVQLAANSSNLEAALQLVEAGGDWQLPKAQRVIGNGLRYAPDILCAKMSHLKPAYIEGRFKMADKIGNNKRAAAEAALKPWLGPEVQPEVKQATVKALVAAGVTPSKPELQQQQQQRRQPAPAPVKPARWSGCLQQQLQQQGVQAAAAAGGEKGWKQQQKWPPLQPTQRIQASGPAAAEKTNGKQPSQQQQKQKGQASAADYDIDALLAALGDDTATAAAPASSKAAASKKKKKETAAQKEAKKQQKLRLQRLQQQQSEDGSGSGSDAEGRDVSLAAAAVAAAEADAGSGVEVQAVAGAATGASEHSTRQQMSHASERVDQLLHDRDQSQLEPEQWQDTAQTKQQKGKQQGKAGLQQPRQQVQQARHGVVGSAAPALQQQHHQQSGVAVAAQEPPAAAARHFLPPHLRAGMPAAAASNSAAAQGAAQVFPAANQLPVPPQQRQQQQQQQRHQQQQQQQHRVQTAHHQQQQQHKVQTAYHHHHQQLFAQQQHQRAHQQWQQDAPGLPQAMLDALAGAGQPPPPPPRPQPPPPPRGAAVAAAPVGDADWGSSSVHAATGADLQRGRHGQVAAAAGATTAGSGPAAAAAAAPITPPSGTRSARPAGRSKPSGGGVVKTHKLCVSCGERRSNVLLMPCKHMVLCDACADVDSCPSCGQPCKQRVKVHQS